MKDPYRLLDVARAATDDDIRKAYRQLARKHHPEKAASLRRKVSPLATKTYRITPGGYRRTSRKDHRAGGSLRLAQEVW